MQVNEQELANDSMTGHKTPRPITVVVASDALLWLEALDSLISSIDNKEVVGQARDFERLGALVAQLKPDVVLVDLPLSGLERVESVLTLRRLQPNISYIILAPAQVEDHTLRALAAFDSVVLTTRDARRSDLVAAFGMLGSKYTVIAPWLLDRILPKIAHRRDNLPTPDVKLTPREKEVLAGIALGRTDQELSRILGISPRTLQTILARARMKLGAVDRTHAVALSLELGLIPGPSTAHEEAGTLSVRSVDEIPTPA